MHHVANLLPSVEMPRYVAIKGINHLRRWQKRNQSRRRDPRQFGDLRESVRFVKPADRIKTLTRGEITIELGNTAISKIRAANYDRQDSIPRGCKSPN